MYAKVIVLVFLAISQASAQTPTCGQVIIPQMTPLQLLNWQTWTLPGQIAAGDCWTQYLQSVANSWTNLYNAAYLAGPPSAAQFAQQTQQARPTQQAQQAPQLAQQALPGTIQG